MATDANQIAITTYSQTAAQTYRNAYKC